MLICEILVIKVEGVERMRKEGKEGEGGKEEGGRKEGRVEGWRMKERKREGRKVRTRWFTPCSMRVEMRLKVGGRIGENATHR